MEDFVPVFTDEVGPNDLIQEVDIELEPEPEPEPTPIIQYRLAANKMADFVDTCRNNEYTADFILDTGAHYTFTPEDGLTFHEYVPLSPACKHFSPSQSDADSLGAVPSSHDKYSKLYLNNTRCQSREIGSPICLVADDHTQCRGYVPEEWISVRLAKAPDKELALTSGRLHNGQPYSRITTNNEVNDVVIGKEAAEKLNPKFDEIIDLYEATEIPVPNTNLPKTPYLQSLMG